MSRTETITTTAGKVAAELARRGIAADETVTITIDLDKELIPGRREARARVVAAGLSDDDIDRLINRVSLGKLLETTGVNRRVLWPYAATGARHYAFVPAGSSVTASSPNPSSRVSSVGNPQAAGDIGSSIVKLTTTVPSGFTPRKLISRTWSFFG